MKIAVLVKQVPDLVEGLEIDASGKALDAGALRYILSEADDHALEEALLIKERGSARIEVFALDVGDVCDALFAALAKGADRATVLLREGEWEPDSHAEAQTYADLLRKTPYDLILTGVRSIADLDGSLGGLLAGYLGLPYVGLIRKVEVTANGTAVRVQKEYAGGFASEIEVELPAVLGIQAAEQPPRYVPISRLRQVMKTATLEELPVPEPPRQRLDVLRLYFPEEGKGATMLSEDLAQAAVQVANLLAERHLLR